MCNPRLFADISNRDSDELGELAEWINAYAAGFPCQPPLEISLIPSQFLFLFPLIKLILNPIFNYQFLRSTLTIILVVPIIPINYLLLRSTATIIIVMILTIAINYNLLLESTQTL